MCFNESIKMTRSDLAMPQLITMLIAAYKFVKEKVEPKTKIEKIRSLAS